MALPDPQSAARDIAPRLGARAPEIEEARRLPQELAAMMADAGLFRLAIPKDIDGHELAPRQMVEVLATIAEGDASAAWCLMIGATTALVAAYLPRSLAEEVLGQRDVITGGVFAPMGKGEVDGETCRVSGRWSWASGSVNCAWLVGGTLLMEGGKPRVGQDGRPQHRMMIMPRSAVTLHDTWQAAGLKGTGSGDMSVKDLEVPLARSVSLIDDQPRASGPLYRFPAFGLLAIGIAGVAAGNARAALDAAREAVGSRRAMGSGRSQAERATVQASLAMAEAELAAARAGLDRAIDIAYAQAESGAIALGCRAHLRLAATHLVRRAADICRTAYDLGGGAALYLESPLQRRFRDAHAMTQHIMVQPAIYEAAGRVLLDLPVDSTML